MPSETSSIETARLRLLPFEPRFINDRYVEWLNDRTLMRYSENRHRRHSIESCIEYAKSFEGTPHFFWAIFCKENHAHIGNINVYRDLYNDVADIGILIGERDISGKGFGREAWIAVCRFLLESIEVRKVTAGTMATNTAMIRIMEASGMQFEGRKSRQFLVDGVEVDLVSACLFRAT